MKGILLALCLIAGLRAASQITYDNVFVDWDSAIHYKNLTIIPVLPKKPGGDPLPKVVTLSQALKQGLATMSERGTASTENVHWLRINNHSDQSIYVSSGEIIAGGRQDRMLARDTILVPDGKDQYIPAMCVEEERWSDKEKKFVYGNYANQHLRKVLDSSRNQVRIWKEVSNQLDEHGIKNTTLAYLARNQDKRMVPLNDEYFKYFVDRFRHGDSTRVGFIAITGNRVIGADIYCNTDLFYNQLEPLLKGYVDEAVILGGPITIPDADVKTYADKLLRNETDQADFVRGNGKIFRQAGKVIHVNSF